MKSWQNSLRTYRRTESGGKGAEGRRQHCRQEAQIHDQGRVQVLKVHIRQKPFLEELTTLQVHCRITDNGQGIEAVLQATQNRKQEGACAIEAQEAI
ncbi:MAG: hypothetical protein IPK73_02995 [Candidatus Obscuribacter sp.]|nr:hypothetical protein [Candidatus Obscuribacter sp.]